MCNESAFRHIKQLLRETTDDKNCPIREYSNLGQAGGGYFKCDMGICEYEDYCKTGKKILNK